MKDKKPRVIMMNVGTEGHIDHTTLMMHERLKRMGYLVTVIGAGHVGDIDLEGIMADTIQPLSIQNLMLPELPKQTLNSFYPQKKRGKGKYRKYY